MTDRELLEKAAKAAEIELTWVEAGQAHDQAWCQRPEKD